MNEKFVVYPTKEVTGYVGVVDGLPEFRKVSDSRGDAKELNVYPTAEEALERFFNVRRVTITIHGEPVTPPSDWGAIE